jgi:hypothetical protein
MSVFHIKFNQYQGEGSYLGGKPNITNINWIPSMPDSKKKQKLLLTLQANFFKSQVLKEDELLSIFISNEKNSINITRQLAVNDNTQSENFKNRYATVLIHKRGSLLAEDIEIFPAASISITPFSADELKEETQTPGAGSEYSKLNGIPGWIQDNVFIEPKYQFWLQLNENDLNKFSNEYDDIFRQGMGYLFLNRNIKKMNITEEPQEAGIFFIQFS